MDTMCATFINTVHDLGAMTTPMDRDFGDDPFRKMERRKIEKKLGHDRRRAGLDIEDPIVPEDQ